MFGLIFGIILLIAGIIFGAWLIGEDYKGAGVGAIIIGVILALILVVCSCASVHPCGGP